MTFGQTTGTLLSGGTMYDSTTSAVTGISAGTSTATWYTVTDHTHYTQIYQPVEFTSYVGSNVVFDVTQRKDTRVIHPRLYFRFVKSKLNKLQERKLNERLLRLQKFVKSAEGLGQKALFEEFSRKIAITVREQELYACGIEYFVDKSVVEKYRHKVKDVTIGFSKLENFDRPVPDRVAKKVKKLQELKMFDEYLILYLNYTEKKDVGNKKKVESPLKTNKEKIKEKDPIIFGVQTYLPEKLYFIADWVDEYCDLTLDKLLEDVKKDDPDYNVKNIDDIDEDYIKRMVQESRERHLRLRGTNNSNFKSHMEEEDKSYSKKIDSGKKRTKVEELFRKHADPLYSTISEQKEKAKKKFGLLVDKARKITGKVKKK